MAIGGRKFVTFFRMLGFVGIEINGINALREAERRSNDYALVCLERESIAGLEDEANELMMRSPNPVILVDSPFEVKEKPEEVRSEMLKVMRSGLIGGS